MASVKFLIKGKKNPSTIYIRFRDGRTIDLSATTSKTINPKFWGLNGIKPKAEFADKLNLEKDLRKLEDLIHTGRNETITSVEVINKAWLERVIMEWQGKGEGFDLTALIPIIKGYVERLSNRVRNGKTGVALGTIKNHQTTIKRLEKFEAFKKHSFKLIEVDLNFHEDYLKFGRNTLGLAPKSLNKDITIIKSVCRDAKERGMVINEQSLSRSFSAPNDKTIFTTLNKSELLLIEGFKGSEYLENARDWLIIGCWTGCRSGDLMKLTKDNLKKHTSGNIYIQYTQSKTAKTVNVPVHAQAKRILDRLGGFPRPISNQNFNKYIKEVCKVVGLTYEIEGSKQNNFTHLKETGRFEKWELIKSHTCRRSFATNHYNELPNKSIMAVTGHATEKQFLEYIGEVESDHIDDFFEAWNNNNGKIKTIGNVKGLK